MAYLVCVLIRNSQIEGPGWNNRGHLPNASRTEKFITSLELAEKEDFCEKERLIELQNRIVDPRFKDSDYRVSQNYVGQTVACQKEIIHFICPKPDALQSLMEGLIDSHKRMKAGNVSPVIHAATIAYGKDGYNRPD